MHLTLRNCQLLLSILVSLLATTVLSAPLDIDSGDINNPNLAGLNTDTWNSTETGMWLIEFFSPMCIHCKHFAPTWYALTELHKHYETSNFKMARVNCMAQGDLCDAQKVSGYPTLKLYKDGSFIEEYHGKRSHDALTTFIVSRASSYKKEQAKGLPVAV